MEKFLSLFAFVAVATGANLPSSRIVGGQPADPGEYPWQVSLHRRAFSFWLHTCGGSLVLSDLVLTAAHCVDRVNKESLRIVAGVNTLSRRRDENIFEVESITMHPGYNSTSGGYPNDFALLKLQTAVPSNVASSVPMANIGDTFVDNNKCWITGWGRTSSTSSTTDILMEANINVIENAVCVSRFPSSLGDVVHETHICVEADGKSACNGDSGGPLVCIDENMKFVLAGVSSWVIQGCERYPNVYGRVGHFKQWINDECEKLNCGETL